jgi:hypothetical protein
MIKPILQRILAAAASAISPLAQVTLSTLIINAVALGADKTDATAPPEVLPPIQPGQFTVKDLGMLRSDICRPDRTQWIFNGSGRVIPLRWSMTGFQGLDYLHKNDGYTFRFDLVENRSGVKIQDNMNENLESWPDPLGWNFRSGSPYCIVQQEEHLVSALRMENWFLLQEFQNRNGII